MRALAAWTLAALAALALAAALTLVYIDRTVFDADGFAARADATLQAGPVRAAAARRLVDATLAARPDLVAGRPLLTTVAEGVVGSGAFRSLVRAAARDAHRSAFDRHATTVTLTAADAAILLRQAAQSLSPDLARRVPRRLDARLAELGGGAEGVALRLAERAERTRRLAVVAFALAAVLALGALAVSRGVRVGVLRLGVSMGAAGALLAAAAAGAGPLAAAQVGAADRDALRAIVDVWLEPLVGWALALAFAGAAFALAAASLLRPVAVGGIARRAWSLAATTPRRPAWRAVRAVAGALLGVALIAWPGRVLEVAAVAAGAVLVLAAVAEILRLTAGPEPARVPRPGRHARVIGVAALLVAGAVAVAALAAGSEPHAKRAGRCNGSAALCDRRLNEVAFAGTHNSMAAAGEPGWLFAAQDAGIPAQLADGIRALLIDTHYGFATPRGVATELAIDSKSREKIAGTVSEEFADTAERLRKRIGYRGGGEREVFLCHAFCEVGATKAVDALAEVHRFLVTHPEEVLILSIEDETPAETTAALIRASGLSHEVYRGPAKPPWPTLRELVERDERVLVLVERRAGDVPWLHPQPVVAQETPYRFRTPEELAAPDSCRPNRGGTVGSLLLVNHWVDTSPAPRPSIAAEVNARDFLGPRLERCRRERGMLPTIVAVDFYRRGDTFAAVDALNGLP